MNSMQKTSVAGASGALIGTCSAMNFEWNTAIAALCGGLTGLAIFGFMQAWSWCRTRSEQWQQDPELLEQDYKNLVCGALIFWICVVYIFVTAALPIYITYNNAPGTETTKIGISAVFALLSATLMLVCMIVCIILWEEIVKKYNGTSLHMFPTTRVCFRQWAARLMKGSCISALRDADSHFDTYGALTKGQFIVITMQVAALPFITAATFLAAVLTLALDCIVMAILWSAQTYQSAAFCGGAAGAAVGTTLHNVHAGSPAVFVLTIVIGAIVGPIFTVVRSALERKMFYSYSPSSV